VHDWSVQLKKQTFFDHFFLKYTQWQCTLSYYNSTPMYKFLKKTNTLCGILTRDLLFCGRTRWPLYHAARAWSVDLGTPVFLIFGVPLRIINAINHYP
jgi:hypothetical protein